MIITRKVEFSASHVCRLPRLSEEENRRIYGAAANPNGHGHNYVVEVSLEGDPDPVTGMVLDLKDLKELLNREVVAPYDHRFLNYETPPFDRVVPTAENIAREIWRRLEPHLRGIAPRLRSIRLYETPDLFVDYFGEQRSLLMPGLAQMATVLQVNRLELNEMIKQEIVKNPALEESGDETSSEEVLPLPEPERGQAFHVTRRYAFSASHRLHSPQLSDDKNRRVYGKCNNPFGHGHNYVMDVSARGPADGATGLAVDVAALDGLVRRQVIEPFDHRNFNADTDAFQDLVPTTENVAMEICSRLKRHWSAAFPGAWPKLEKIRIAETERNIFELRADEIE